MSYKILAVDDNSINLKLLRRALMNSSYEVLTADNGPEAIQITQREKPDMILLDVLMPEMDGYEVCARIKSDIRTRRIPIIFLSAKNDSVDKARGLALGAVDYLTKPFDPVEINARIRNHLENNDHLLSDPEVTGKPGHENWFGNLFGKYSRLLEEEITSPVLIRSHQKLVNTIGTIRYQAHKVNPKQVFLMFFNGLENTPESFAVEMMVSHFIRGYLAASPEQDWDCQALAGLINRIMENYSPDEYRTAFTFQAALIDSGRKDLCLFNLRQPHPLIISNGVRSEPPAGKITLESEFDRIVQGERMVIEPGMILAFYLRGLETRLPAYFPNLCLSLLNETNYQLDESARRILDELDTTDEDQMVLFLQVP